MTDTIPAGAPAPGTYTLDPERTTIRADVKAMFGLMTVHGTFRQVRQKPGKSNALGLVKFLFPNDNNVYLHSTPQQALFSRTRRDFSHGCIRVEDPVALAEWTLRGQDEWTKKKIESAIGGKKDDIYVRIQRPINVTIMYATAAATANGDVHFFEDIYGHDVQLAKVLEPEQKGAPVLVAAK